MRPADRKEAVKYLEEHFKVSERRSCRVLKINRTVFRRQPTRDEQAFLRKRIKEIASVRIRYGYRRIHVLLRREGWAINEKRVYRLYKQEGLNLRGKTKRKRISQSRVPDRNSVQAVNVCWTMDFVQDQLFNGKRFRILTVMDVFSRECLATYAEKAIKGEKVCEVLDELKQTRGLAARIKVDNGPEFISRALDAWAYFNQVKLDYSRPGTPTDNPHIESFNGSLRDECLNTNWFMSVIDAQEKLERWRNDYNEFRPHSSLAYLTPVEYARKHSLSAV